MPWKSPSVQSLAQNLSQSLLQNPLEQVSNALSQVVAQRLSQLARGVERYRLSPYVRDVEDPPPVWQEGSSRLLKFGRRSGVPVFFVPSLINKAYILDLDQERSLVRWLAERGFCVYLLDWGHPSTDERTFNLTDYVERLARAMAFVQEPVQLVGYCMGGNIALAAAQRYPLRVKKLTLLATPWDTQASGQGGAAEAAALYKLWRPYCEQVAEELPIDLIQTLFTILDPLGPQQKFIDFEAEEDPVAVERFVALEDWLNDGVSLALPVADECLLGWFGENSAARGKWLIHGEPVMPEAILKPTLVMSAEQDMIVPPASSRAIVERFPFCLHLSIPLGHIGMIVSRKAPILVWEPLAKWLKAD